MRAFKSSGISTEHGVQYGIDRTVLADNDNGSGVASRWEAQCTLWPSVVVLL